MASMWDIIVKNEDASGFMIGDLGIEIEALSQETLSEQFSYVEIAGSDDLRNAVSIGTLILNVNTVDLSNADAAAFLQIVNSYVLKGYYTKTEMDTIVSGLGSSNTTLQNEVNAIETAVGLNADGTYAANASGNYIAGATSALNADTLLDAAIKAVNDALGTEVTDRTNADALKVNKAGDTMTGALEMGANPVRSTFVPAAAGDLTNKAYVDTLIATGMTPKMAVRTVTSAALPACTYDNGTSGVGATLTADANGELVAISGVTLAVGERVLIKNQANQVQNGIYTVTSLGSAATPFVLTRALDFDDSPDGEVFGGSFTTVSEGSEAGNQYVLLGLPGNAGFVIGTSNLVWTIVNKLGSFDVLQAEIDAIETGAGLSASGQYVPNGSAHYTSTATTLMGADNLLDAKLYEVEQAFIDHTNGVGAPVHEADEISVVGAKSNIGTSAGAILEDVITAIDTKIAEIQEDTEPPVVARVLGIGLSTAPATPVVNEYFVDDANRLQKWSGTAWVDMGELVVGSRVINLANANQEIFVRGASSWATEGAVVDSASVVVKNNDTTDRPASWLYDIDTHAWIRDGIAEIHTSLDDAYNEGSNIAADNGPVTINTGAATSAGFRMVVKANTPTTGLVGGEYTVKEDGMEYIYDATRSKWLSSARQYLVFGREGLTRNQYLNIGAGALPSNAGGLRIGRTSTIVGITCQFDDTTSADATVRVEANDVAGTAVSTLLVGSGLSGSQSVSKNDDIAAGDYLQAFLACNSRVKNPVVIVELAYKG